MRYQLSHWTTMALMAPSADMTSRWGRYRWNRRRWTTSSKILSKSTRYTKLKAAHNRNSISRTQHRCHWVDKIRAWCTNSPCNKSSKLTQASNKLDPCKLWIWPIWESIKAKVAETVITSPAEQQHNSHNNTRPPHEVRLVVHAKKWRTRITYQFLIFNKNVQT